MRQKIWMIILVATIVVIGGGAFFGGVKYSEGKGQQTLRNFSAGMQQGLNGRAEMTGRTGGITGGGIVSGEIISGDDQSVTVKLRDGGSKIIFFSSSTEISKFTSGAASDLGAGKIIMVSGKANQDGSVVAQTIQIRPEVAPAPAVPTSKQ